MDTLGRPLLNLHWWGGAFSITDNTSIKGLAQIDTHSWNEVVVITLDRNTSLQGSPIIKGVKKRCTWREKKKKKAFMTGWQKGGHKSAENLESSDTIMRKDNLRPTHIWYSFLVLRTFVLTEVKVPQLYPSTPLYGRFLPHLSDPPLFLGSLISLCCRDNSFGYRNNSFCKGKCFLLNSMVLVVNEQTNCQLWKAVYPFSYPLLSTLLAVLTQHIIWV